MIIITDKKNIMGVMFPTRYKNVNIISRPRPELCSVVVCDLSESTGEKVSPAGYTTQIWGDVKSILYFCNPALVQPQIRKA